MIFFTILEWRWSNFNAGAHIFGDSELNEKVPRYHRKDKLVTHENIKPNGYYSKLKAFSFFFFCIFF